MHPWIDPREAPLYIVRYPRERTERDVKEAHDGIRAIYEGTRVCVAWVVDASEVRDAPATQRRIVAEHEQRVRPHAERWCAGLAVVLPNPLARGFFTAVTWFAPLTYPHTIVETREEALQWARARLAGRADHP